MQKSRNFKRIILMVTIVAMIAVSVPMVSYGDEQPETIKKEYIITSSGDLSAVKADGHIVDVVLADSHTALIKSGQHGKFKQRAAGFERCLS